MARRITIRPAKTAALFAVLGLFLAAAAASAQTQPRPAAPAQAPAASAAPRQLGNYDGWLAAEAGTGPTRVCYVIGRPVKVESKPAGARRADPTLSVAHYPGVNKSNELTWFAGYPLRDGGAMEIEIGRVKVPLSNLDQPGSDRAWTREDAANRTAIDAMRAAAPRATALVRGVSARGTETTDTYNLTGFARALADIDRACNVRR
ncbi:MAG: hypothetical protein ING44_10035 [Telmatospirillum sp.]|nr:hypothetical protein [Telmatospirillum sp.]